MSLAIRFFLLAGVTISFWFTSSSVAEDRIWNAFSAVEKNTEIVLADWYENTYLASLEYSEFLIRSRFVVFDPVALDRHFKASLDDAERFEKDSRGRFIYPDVKPLSDSDLSIEMFPDRKYRIAIVRHNIGRSSGMSMVHGWILDEGFTGRERVYFEVKRDGKLVFAFMANPRMYIIGSTPMDGVAVISVFDLDGVTRSNARRIH